MSPVRQADAQNLILFVGSYLEEHKRSLASYKRLFGEKLIPLVLVSNISAATKAGEIVKDSSAIIIDMPTLSVTGLQTLLKPYENRILAATFRSERHIELFKAVIPHVPYLNAPSQASLTWGTEKIRMRDLLRNYDKTIAPKFVVAHDATEATINRIERNVGYPLVVKPSGLAASLLVSVCYHREELEKNLGITIKKIRALYKEKKGRGEPEILVEQLMEGTMYSIDAYVNARGVTYFCPPVTVRTGRSIGFDDFFGYQQLTPVKIKQHKIDDANEACEKAIRALGLRSTTCHIELMNTEEGWKIIELGPRIGGFRDEMYMLSYGIDHSLNDLLIRIPKRPIIQRKAKGYTVIMKFYARKEGKLTKLTGLTKARALESFHRLEQQKKIGDQCLFAKNGGTSVVNVIMFNKSRSRLLADIRRLEQNMVIKVETKRKVTKA